MRAIAITVLVPVVFAVPKGPRFDWSTLPVFFQGANISGPMSHESLRLLAKFPMVTIIKTQGPCSRNPATPECNQEAVITDELRRVKALNPNVSTIIYFNSVFDYPQYRLHATVGADTSLQLKDAKGKPVSMSAKGTNKVMDVFDFSNDRMRQLFIEDCVNATKTGYVDGCFADRAVIGTPTDSDNAMVPCGSANPCTLQLGLSDETARAWFHGEVKVLTDLQKALGEGPLIVNGAFGPPYDAFGPGRVSFSMIEKFGPNNASIQLLRHNAANGRGVQAHALKADEDNLAAFLIGAGYRAYFGFGDWSDSSQSGLNAKWQPAFDWPLGAPLGDGVYDAADGGVWKRRFEHVNVTFKLLGGKGTIRGWKFPVSTDSALAPPVPVPAPAPDIHV